MKLGRRFIRCAGITSLAAAGLWSQPAHADELTGGIPGEWLSHYSSARTAGLGNAFVASANEPFGMLWNPAGLHGMFQNEVHFETARLFEAERTKARFSSWKEPSDSFKSFVCSNSPERSESTVTPKLGILRMGMAKLSPLICVSSKSRAVSK